MTGPYTAEVFLNCRRPWLLASNSAPNLTMAWETERDELTEGSRLAMRFWRTGGGATLKGTLQSATLAIGLMLEPGEAAYIRLRGKHAGNSCIADDATVRRDEAGNLFTSLGSRQGERKFIGV